ncbi:protein rep [Klebsiella variicola subsp. variicola]|uniref:protein rep n=1 Tax=Klebsiella variicola TaxID=244366 RepID=UPI003CFF3FEF
MLNITQQKTDVKYKLTELAKINADILNKRKSQNIELAKHFYRRSNTTGLNSVKQRANRIFGCNLNRFSLIANDYAYNILTNRCRDRHCPDCQRVRSFIWQDDIMKIIPSLTTERDNDGFLFITLTVKNPLVSDLSAVMDAMSIAFKRMMQIEFSSFLVGGVRTFEITRGKKEKNRCHPHIHALLQVKNTYFKHHYISKKFLSEIWLKHISRELVKVNLFNPNDYNLGIIVDISRVISADAYDKIRQKQTLKKELKNSDYLNSKNINIKNNGQKVINYVLKYATKDNNLFNGDSWSFEYDKQIKGKRLISTFGSYKVELAKYRKEKRCQHYNEAEFLDKLKSRANIKNIEDTNIFYCVYDNEYLVERVTLNKALFNKRHMIVKNIEKKQTESSQLAIIANITDKALNDNLKKYNQIPTSTNLEKVNNTIMLLNKKRDSDRRLHRRLVDSGHRVMIDEYQYYLSGDESNLYNTFAFCADVEPIDNTELCENYLNPNTLVIIDSVEAFSKQNIIF